MRPPLDRESEIARLRDRLERHRAPDAHSLAEVLHPDGTSIHSTR
jgi:hypothetical protein